LFKTRRDEEPATSEPSQEDVGSEFDNLFGGDAEPAPEVKPQMPSPYEMGKAAFHAGKGSAPALNQEFQDAYLAKGAKVGSPESKAYTEAIKAYSKGWMEANLAAPVPGVTDSPEGKGEKSEEPEGKPVVFSDLKPGHVIKGKTAGKTCMVVGKQGELLLFQTPKGNLFQTSKVNVEENYELVSDDPSAYTFAEGEDGPTVGQTKTISGTTYFFNRNHRWEKQGEEPKAEQEQAPAPESPAPETSPISGKITGLNPGGNHGDNSTFTTPKGVQLIRSKQGNGAYLYINKHYSTGEESGTILPKKLKDAILAIPGASLNAPHMKKKTAWMEVPFEQAEAMEKVLASHEDGSLLAGQTAKKPKAPKTESVAYESGSHVPFKDLKVGMKFDAPGSNYEYEVIKKNPQSVQIKVAHKSNGGSYETKITAKHWASGYEGMCPLKGENGEGQAEHHVGETKVENGKTYVLNENHKWELAPGQEPEAKPKKKAAAKVDDAFPFKQVGPQGGAQPGGVFEDEFGQKWYIKFPPSEDVCKNEVLALKLYESILGKSSVPSVKMVHAKGIPGIASDGKMGIASKWMDGLKEDPSALASGKVANVYEGFALDAWLGNRDVVGGNQSQYKNMVVGPDNKAVRVDAGGALLYTGLGHAKNDFGADVTEVEKLLNPSVNHETARIYKGITKDQITQSVAKVLEVPDEFVKAMVDKFGPGDEAAKAALVDKLIARKNNLAKKFPEADLVAHPPAPDKRHLQVDPSKLPGMLD
ncbi:MAG TPA: hypothetical protein VN436_03500, partial [Holophaga sp.]|nr:hypothetical protein [Holophaga sp.]